MMNSENIGARSTENRVLDRKICTLEALKGKMVFSGVFGGHLWNFRVAGRFWHNGIGLLRNLGFF
jgi:hypothetical protein